MLITMLGIRPCQKHEININAFGNVQKAVGEKNAEAVINRLSCAAPELFRWSVGGYRSYTRVNVSCDYQKYEVIACCLGDGFKRRGGLMPLPDEQDPLNRS
jgi:hypothetical protein